MQLNKDPNSNEEIILENAIKNHNYKSLALFSAEAQRFLIKNKFNEQQKNELLIASLEHNILDDNVFIELCRESQEYNNLLSAFRSDALRRGYYDAGRIEEIYFKSYKDEFENKKEKKGQERNEHERGGIACKIKNSILKYDFIRLFENQDKVIANDKLSLKKFLSAELTYGIKSWTDRIYFWFRIVWSVASVATIISSTISKLFVVSLFTSFIYIIVDTGIYYLNKYFFRDEKSAKESYERNAKLDKLLKKAKEIYSRVTQKEKELYLKDLKKNNSFKLVFSDKYNKKHIFKLLSSYLFGISLVLGIIFAMSSVVMIPAVSSYIFSASVSFSAILTVSIISSSLFVLSAIGCKLSRNKYKTLKNEFTKEKTEIAKTKLELSEDFKNKIKKSKIKPSPGQEMNDNRKEKDEI